MAPETEVIEKPELVETHESEPAQSDESTERLRQAKRHEAEVAIAVGLALLRSNLDRDEYYAQDYTCAVLDSDYGMSRIEKVAKSYEMSDNWLDGLVREILRAQGQTKDESESADVTALVAAAKKVTAAYAEADDYYDLLPLAGHMFAAGRLSKEAETGYHPLSETHSCSE
jgi:hypothetical protein